MLYLEARCLARDARGRLAGRRRTAASTASTSTASVPDGMREVIAENLLRDDARPRVVHRQRHADVVLRHPPHRAHAAAAARRLGLPLLGLRLDPGLRQRVRPVELQRRGHRRLPRRAARLGLRGRACARATTTSCCPLRRRAAEACRAVFDELGLAAFTDEDVDAVRASRTARSTCPTLDPRPRAGRRRPDHGAGRHGARRRARARAARLRDRGRAGARDAPPAPLRRLPADLGDLRRGHARPLGPHRPERLRGPGHGLPACRRARRAEVARVRQVWSPADLAAEQARGRGLPPRSPSIGPARASRRGRRGRRRRSRRRSRRTLWVALYGI